MPTIICVSRANKKVDVQLIEIGREKKNSWKLCVGNGGGAIVKVDTTNKGKTMKEKRLDYNPIIRVPIKGV